MNLVRCSMLLVLASSILGGCASDEPRSAYEGRSGLYESIAAPGTRLIYATAGFLQRTPLYTSSEDIPGGIYKPTEFYRAMSNLSSCSLSSIRVMDAILTGKTSAYTRSRPPLPPLPVEKTPLELLNEQSRKPPFEFGGAAPVRSSQFNCMQCSAPSDGGCGESWPVTVQADLELANLAYVVVVNNSRKCCSYDIQPQTRDLSLLQAMKEQTEYQVSAAATTYSDSEVPELLLRLPVKYSKVADSELGLPPALSEFVKQVFQSTSKTIAGRFPLAERRATEVTFDIKQMDPKTLIDYGGWFQALSNNDDPNIYIAPLLTRAPFYICYNQGVEQFVRARSNLAGKVLRDTWRSFTNEDIRALAEGDVKLNEQFTRCVTSQLAFIFAHEIGHKYVLERGKNPPDRAIEEQLADCFGLANAKLGGPFDLFIFNKLVTTDPAANGDAIKGLELRIEKIRQLSLYFDTTAPPTDGRQLVSTCRKLVLTT